MKTINISVQNIKCGGCANTITKKLQTIAGLSNIVIDVPEQVVSFDCLQEATVDVAKDTLKQLGYPEVGESNGLGSKAKSFVSCAVGKMNA
jgi:copper chaperone CopZ